MPHDSSFLASSRRRECIVFEGSNGWPSSFFVHKKSFGLKFSLHGLQSDAGNSFSGYCSMCLDPVRTFLIINTQVNQQTATLVSSSLLIQMCFLASSPAILGSINFFWLLFISLSQTFYNIQHQTIEIRRVRSNHCG